MRSWVILLAFQPLLALSQPQPDIHVLDASSSLSRRDMHKDKDNSGQPARIKVSEFVFEGERDRLEHWDYQSTVRDLMDWCNAGNEVQPGKNQLFAQHTAQAFVCTYGGRNPCSGIEWRQVTMQLNRTKLARESEFGWAVRVNSWNKAFGVVPSHVNLQDFPACRKPESGQSEIEIDSPQKHSGS